MFHAIAEAPVAQIQVALTLESGRHIVSFPNNVSIWSILKSVEAEKKLVLTTASVEVKPKKGDKIHYYNQPIVNFMSTDLATNTDLRKSTLATLGVKSGSAVLRVRFKPTEVELNDFLTADLLLAETEADESKEAEQRIADAKVAAKLRYDEDLARKAEEGKVRKESEERQIAEQRAAAAAREAEQLEAQKFAADMEAATQHSLKSAPRSEVSISAATSSSAPQPAATAHISAQPSASSPNAMQVDAAPAAAEPAPRKKFEVVVEPPGPPGMLDHILSEGGMVDSDYSRLHELLRNAQGDVIEKANKLPSEPCDRDIRVFAPSNKPFDASSLELPDDFFNVTPEELAKERQSAAKQKSGADLKTKEMKERERLAKLSRFKKCFVRFRFPDRVELQAAFYPQEGLAHLTEVIASQLADPNLKFHLFTTPPTTNVHATKNLRDQGFLPAALVHVGLAPGAKGTSPFLKPEAMALIQEKTFAPVVREFKSASEVQIVAAEPVHVEPVAAATSSASMDVDEDTQAYKSSTEGKGSSEKKTPKWFTAGLRKK